jgi:hypothetical protein
MTLLRRSLLTVAVLAAGVASDAQQQPQPPASGSPGSDERINLGSDANGNPLRRALKTGHVSNYDESKVPPYTLPDPLVNFHVRLSGREPAPTQPGAGDSA